MGVGMKMSMFMLSLHHVPPWASLYLLTSYSHVNITLENFSVNVAFKAGVRRRARVYRALRPAPQR